MTYLELVNNVLKRLRERTVATVTSNAYSTLIGVLVNDARQEVEDAWQWSGLRTTLTDTTSAGDYTYSLTGSGNRATVLSVMDDTNNHQLIYKDADYFNTQYYLSDTVVSGKPLYYSYGGLDANGDTVVEVFPKPDGAYDLRFDVVLRSAELTADANEMDIPTQPVLLLAYAKAIEERGEDGGVSASSAYMTAQRSLADAISLDAAKHPEELIWENR